MPASFGLDVEALGERTHDKLARPKSLWFKAVGNSGCRQDGSWLGEIDRPLQKALLAVGEFFDWLEAHAPRRRQELTEAVRTLDASHQQLPAPLEKYAVAMFEDMRDYFIAVCKGKPVDPDEFDSYLSAFESFLLDRLAPRTFESQNAIDRILQEAGDAPNA